MGMLTPSMVARYDTKAQLFDDFYQFVLGYAVELLLPPAPRRRR